MDLAPIRKLVVGAVAFGLTLAFHAVGLDLGPDIVNEAAMGLVTFGAMWAAKDPRVAKGEHVVEPLLDRAEHIIAMLEKRGAQAETQTPPPTP